MILALDMYSDAIRPLAGWDERSGYLGSGTSMVPSIQQGLQVCLLHITLFHFNPCKACNIMTRLTQTRHRIQVSELD